MRSYLSKAIQKIDKLSYDQIRNLIQELSLENSSLKTVLTCLSDAIIACTRDYHPWYINVSAQCLLGIKKMNEQAPIWQQISNPTLEEFVRNAFLKKQYIKDSPISTGESVLSFTIDPLAGKGRISGWLIVARDVTYEHQQTSLRRGDESLSKLANMTAILAHEIRNPLTAISIHLQLIKTYQSKKGHQQDVDECLRIISEEVQHLNAVTAHFLSTARPVKIHPQPKNLSELMQRTASLIRPEVEDSRAVLHVHTPDHPVPVMVDEDSFRLALVNLIRNALSAISSEGGKVELIVCDDGDMVRISVCDNGSGIPLDKQDKIFEPYYTTKENGSGLGLTLVYKVIREHGGSISVISPVSPSTQGTKFTISLPKQNYGKPRLTFGGC